MSYDRNEKKNRRRKNEKLVFYRGGRAYKLISKHAPPKSEHEIYRPTRRIEPRDGNRTEPEPNEPN